MAFQIPLTQCGRRKLWCVFRVKSPFSNSSDLVWTGPNCSVWMVFFSATSYRITVHTGDVKDAGTQSNVSVELFGDKGRSPKLKLGKSETYNTKFCRDQLDIFTVYNIPHLGDLHKIQVWHDRTGPKHEWFVKGFYVEDKSTRKVYFFNCNAWIGRDADKQDIKCEGYTLPEGKHGKFSFSFF